MDASLNINFDSWDFLGVLTPLGIQCPQSASRPGSGRGPRFRASTEAVGDAQWQERRQGRDAALGGHD